MIWRARDFSWTFPRPALVMGILNLTPDSFSDGGRYLECDAALARAGELMAEGADLIDVGGESSRPGAAPVPEEEELRRVLPVIAELGRQTGVAISIDTHKPGVARAALKAGASVVNDIGAQRPGEEMWRLVAETGAGYVLMHMRGTPQTMQAEAEYRDVVKCVADFFGEGLQQTVAAGMLPHQIVLDVGIGFAKRANHNLQLLAALPHFMKYERPLLLGVSRKSFLGPFAPGEPAARAPGGLACAVLARAAGVSIIRTHDVAGTVQALRVTEAILAYRRANDLDHNSE